MRKYVVEKIYHIKGTPTKEEVKGYDFPENYVSVSVYYNTGKGYFLSLWKEGRNKEMVSRCYDFSNGRSKTYQLINCTRPGKKREAEAVGIMNNNLDRVLTEFTKGYEIEEGTVINGYNGLG